MHLLFWAHASTHILVFKGVKISSHFHNSTMSSEKGFLLQAASDLIRRNLRSQKSIGSSPELGRSKEKPSVDAMSMSQRLSVSQIMKSDEKDLIENEEGSKEKSIFPFVTLPKGNPI